MTVRQCRYNSDSKHRLPFVVPNDQNRASLSSDCNIMAKASNKKTLLVAQGTRDLATMWVDLNMGAEVSQAGNSRFRPSKEAIRPHGFATYPMAGEALQAPGSAQGKPATMT
jgi:hypothetical protein